MTFMQVLQREVSNTIQSRGREYFRLGAVRTIHMEEDTIKATVQGSKPYEVRIEFAGRGEIAYCCSCPYFESNTDVCKHIWAAFLAAERDALLPDWNSRMRLDLYPDDSESPEEEDEEEDDLFDEYDEEEDEEELHEDDDLSGSYSDSSRKTLRQRQSERMKHYWQQRRTQISGAASTKARPARPPKPPGWKQHFESLLRQSPPRESSPEWPPGREILYVVRAETGPEHPGLAIEIEARERRKNGAWGKPRAHSIAYQMLPSLPDPQDRQILQILIGTPRYSMHADTGSCFYPSAAALAELLPLICRTGRCFLRFGDLRAELQPFDWDAGGPWQFQLEVRREESAYAVIGSLRRGEEWAGLEEPAVLFRNGFCVLRGRIGRFDDGNAFDWIRLLRREKRIEVPAGDRDVLLQELLRMPQLPPLELPEELRFEQVRGSARPLLKIRRSPNSWERALLQADLSFDYAGLLVPQDGANAIADAPNRRRILRDNQAEKSAVKLLGSVGFRLGYSPKGTVWVLNEAGLPRAVRELTAAGWQVEAEGKLFRTAGAFKIEVSSGIDWFELRGTVDFGGSSATLPVLLAALRRKENTIRLDDGSMGILPEEWLRKYGILAGLGTAEGNHLRFSRCQTGLLDALLAAEPEASCDAVFERARTRLREFDGVAPAMEAPGFCGQLREYQREGLGWINFLREFGFGGCLADDMGLGKTIQVLALLETRRELRHNSGEEERPAPSLVVAPRSLIFNWRQEAARFTPRLRVLDHTGIGRAKVDHGFDPYDLILTTYGTLRRDAAFFRNLRFDYVILDEAQAIKNAGTASAKAARLLKGSHRLALSGTPVENHLGELWSIFEFLNPGMLGSASVLKLGQGELRKPDTAARELLASALRPFILRRTKAQVALDLPDKVEQTLYCELDAAQRRLYNELRDHYRQQLLQKVEREGIRKTSIQILEALLRLRQAAIHPGLIDPRRTDESSAKLEALLPQLDEVLDAGHKALVFSQFTSMLAILKPKLQNKQISFAYLDGKTRDREAEVERFQNDPSCRLFLISLKAGGLGLNLTAAEYVFLLDPWWNPAVEMQAVDRSHRIGQTRTVFAYRLIARDTVEEKVLELQRTKRDLADAIINADNSLIRDLRPEDLAILLS
jgi:superfamily II DNA or RNA helicase